MLPIRPKQKSGSRKRKLLKARNEDKRKMAKFMIDFTQKNETSSVSTDGTLEMSEISGNDALEIDDDSVPIYGPSKIEEVYKNDVSEINSTSTRDVSENEISENHNTFDENIGSNTSITDIVKDKDHATNSMELQTCTSFSIEVSNFSYNQDPATWDIVSDNMIEYFINNPPEKNINLITETSKIIGGKNRLLTESNFYRLKQNGEKIMRDWLVLSPSNKCLFCWVCKLFASNISKLATCGFDDWKHVSVRLSEHENSLSHRNCLLKMAQRLKVSGRIDSVIIMEFKNEVSYWREVLKRVIETVKFLSSRGKPFFGDDETIGSVHNGNFLGCLELIAKFDPLLSAHLAKYGNPGRGNTNYMSSTSIDEFVHLMAKKVLDNIVEEVKRAKYFSIIVDSTPDVTHLDQLSFVLRYVDSDHSPVERYIKFIPIYGHGAEYLTETVLSSLKDLDLDISLCRGQSYDNASNMAGKYSGLQARIKKINPLAEFIPCSAHSLNLVGVHAVESCTTVLKFFSLLQELYNFSSISTHRWQLLHESLTHTIKSCSSTRWCANAEATKTLRKNYREIINILQDLSNDRDQKASTRLEAASLHKKLLKTETVLNVIIWDTVLQRINKTSKLLQDSSANIGQFSSLFHSLIQFVKNVRENFDLYEKEAMDLLPVPLSYEATRKKFTPRSRCLDDVSNSEVQFEPRDKFIKMCHYVLCDSLISELSIRKEPYDRLSAKFSCLINLKDNPSLHETAKSLQLDYATDLDEDFPDELLQFSSFIEKGDKITEIFKTLHDNPYLSSGFPNVETIARIFLTMPISNCTAERSFSLLKRLKSPLRSYLQQDKLSSLALLCINNDLTQKLQYDDIIDIFANAKTRKKNLIC